MIIVILKKIKSLILKIISLSIKNKKNIIGIIILFSIFLFIFDYSNIGILNITDGYDWISVIVTVIASIATLYIGQIALKSNENFSKNNLKIDGYSKINFSEVQYYYNLADTDSFIMKLNDCFLSIPYNKNDSEEDRQQKILEFLKEKDKKFIDVQFRFLLNIKDEREKLLKDFFIEKLTIDYNNESSFNDKSKRYEFIANNNNSFFPIINDYSQSDSQGQHKEMSYITFSCIANSEIIHNIQEARNLKLTFILSVRNSFNIVTKCKYELLIFSDTKYQTSYNRIVYHKTYIKTENISIDYNNSEDTIHIND